MGAKQYSQFVVGVEATMYLESSASKSLLTEPLGRLEQVFDIKWLELKSAVCQEFNSKTTISTYEIDQTCVVCVQIKGD